MYYIRDNIFWNLTYPLIVIHSPDTNIMILCIQHFSKFWCGRVLFSHRCKKKSMCIPIFTLAESLGSSACGKLTAFHAVIGRDNNSAFSKIGKTRTWNILRQMYINFMACLLLEIILYHRLKLFTSHMYPSCLVQKSERHRYIPL